MKFFRCHKKKKAQLRQRSSWFDTVNGIQEIIYFGGFLFGFFFLVGILWFYNEVFPQITCLSRTLFMMIMGESPPTTASPEGWVPEPVVRGPCCTTGCGESSESVVSIVLMCSELASIDQMKGVNWGSIQIKCHLQKHFNILIWRSVTKPEKPESLSESAWERPGFMMTGRFPALVWFSAFLFVVIALPAALTRSSSPEAFTKLHQHIKGESWDNTK